MTTEQKTPVILHQEDGTQTIQLSSDYGNYDVTQTVARITKKGVRIIRLASGEKPKKFWATNEEMDTLAHAWLAYCKAEQEKVEAAAAAERKMIEDALELAKTCPLLTIEELPEEGDNDGMAWKVSASELSIKPYYPSCNASELAEQVACILKAYEPYKDAMDILKTYPEIHIKKDRRHWWVSIPDPRIYGEWATDTSELLTHVQEAKEKYDKHQAQQAEVA